MAVTIKCKWMIIVRGFHHPQSGSVASTVTSQRVSSWGRTFLCGVCMFSPWSRGLPAGAPVSQTVKKMQKQKLTLRYHVSLLSSILTKLGDPEKCRRVVRWWECHLLNITGSIMWPKVVNSVPPTIQAGNISLLLTLLAAAACIGSASPKVEPV